MPGGKTPPPEIRKADRTIIVYSVSLINAAQGTIMPYCDTQIVVLSDYKVGRVNKYPIIR